MPSFEEQTTLISTHVDMQKEFRHGFSIYWGGNLSMSGIAEIKILSKSVN